jgi:hypothetical protein
MKRIIGMSAAGLIVLLQLVGFADWRAEPSIYLAPIAPIEAPAVTHAHPA